MIFIKSLSTLPRENSLNINIAFWEFLTQMLQRVKDFNSNAVLSSHEVSEHCQSKSTWNMPKLFILKERLLWHKSVNSLS